MGTLNTDPPDSQPTVPTPSARPVAPSRRRLMLVFAVLALLLGIAFGPPLFSWERMGEERAKSLSNIRRVAQGALLYAQDWDVRTMPPPFQVNATYWQTWPDLLRPYVSPASTFSNPSNELLPFTSNVRDPKHGFPINSAYAVNRRLWNTFAPGPFPLDDLELPEQTVFFVEAGPLWRNPKRAISRKNLALLDYGDTLDRCTGFCPYPSTHDGRMAVVAIDGHGLLITVEHYSPSDGPHEPLYGRLGGEIYNWNGGHPNGETDGPPHE